MKTKGISVSIIILCANNEDIDICIDSIISQMINDDEIIIVLDNAPSEIIAKVLKYSTRSNISTVYSQKNGNRSHNRNLGRLHSKHDYLIFVDGDMYLRDNCIDKFKNHWVGNSQLCIVGNTRGMAYTKNQFMFMFLDKELNDKYTTIAGRNELLNDSRLADFRTNSVKAYEDAGRLWLYFYSTCCGIPKNAFDEVGGFDESFTTWGAEDVDMGYRLSKICKIYYDLSFYALHLPHERINIKNMITNFQNLRILFEKHKSFEFEARAAFSSGRECIDELKNIFQIIINSGIECKPLSASNDFEIVINRVCPEYPLGNVSYCARDEHFVENIIGMALPFYNKSFTTSLISSDIFMYPMRVYTKILQEATRVAKKTYIVQSEHYEKIDWGNLNINEKKLESNFFHYTSNDIIDFKFTLQDDGMYLVEFLGGNLVNTYKKWIFDDTYKFNDDILQSLRANLGQTEEFILINLTENENNDCPIESLEKLLDIKIITTYNFSICDNMHFLSDTICNQLAKYNFNFIFFTENHTSLDFSNWISLRNGHKDLCVDITGVINIIPTE